jgi:hypothetical protein
MSNDYHDHNCQFCTEEFECQGGFSCSDNLCRDCKHRLQDLQPAAKTLMEVLMKRIVRLEEKAKASS